MEKVILQAFLRSIPAGLCAVFLFFSTACNSETAPDCLKSTGPTVRIPRAFKHSSQLFVSDNINVTLSPLPAHTLELEGGRNVLHKIAVDTFDVLAFENQNTCDFVRSYKRPINAYLADTAIENIRQFGFGDIKTTDTITGPHFQVQGYGAGNIDLQLNNQFTNLDLNGFGNLRLTGRTRLLKAYQLKYYRLDARSFSADTCIIGLDGEGDLHLNCNTYLKAHIRGPGNVYYSGNAVAERSGSGSGKLIKE
ncbi:MAG: DUF2807 domain-containing protein [Bacteroidota bacterium]